VAQLAADPPAAPHALMLRLQRQARLAAGEPPPLSLWERLGALLWRPATGFATVVAAVITTGVWTQYSATKAGPALPTSGQVALATDSDRAEASRGGQKGLHDTTIDPSDRAAAATTRAARAATDKDVDLPGAKSAAAVSAAAESAAVESDRAGSNARDALAPAAAPVTLAPNALGDEAQLDGKNLEASGEAVDAPAAEPVAAVPIPSPGPVAARGLPIGGALGRSGLGAGGAGNAASDGRFEAFGGEGEGGGEGGGDDDARRDNRRSAGVEPEAPRPVVANELAQELKAPVPDAEIAPDAGAVLGQGYDWGGTVGAKKDSGLAPGSTVARPTDDAGPDRAVVATGTLVKESPKPQGVKLTPQQAIAQGDSPQTVDSLIPVSLGERRNTESPTAADPRLLNSYKPAEPAPVPQPSLPAGNVANGLDGDTTGKPKQQSPARAIAPAAVAPPAEVVLDAPPVAVATTARPGESQSAAAPRPATGKAANDAFGGLTAVNDEANADTNADDFRLAEKALKTEEKSKSEALPATTSQLEAGEAHYRAQRYGQAIREFEGYLDQSKLAKKVAPTGTTEARRRLAESYERTNQLERAAGQYKVLLATNKGYAYRSAVLVDAAEVEARLGRLDSARALLREALADPAMQARAKARLADVEKQLGERLAADAKKKKAAGASSDGEAPTSPAAAPSERVEHAEPSAAPPEPGQKTSNPKKSDAPDGAPTVAPAQ
jgi:tetratricopeptide (TPR) repeat protein